MTVYSDLWIVDQQQVKGIEIELTQKSAKRYKNLWQEFRMCMPTGGVVLYLTSWPDGPASLLRMAAEFRKDRIYAARLETFRDKLGRCPFYCAYNRKPLFLDRQPILQASRKAV